MMFFMRLIAVAVLLFASSSATWAAHQKCNHERFYCLNRCALARDLGRLPDKVWHRCNTNCLEAAIACERRCITRWSCGGLVR